MAISAQDKGSALVVLQSLGRVREMRGVRLLLVLVALLCVIRVMAGAYVTQGARRIGLVEGSRRGYIEVSFSATGSFGLALEMTIRSQTNARLEVTIDPGLVLGSRNPSYQRLVLLSMVERRQAGDVRIRYVDLDPYETRSIGLEGYCLDAHLDLPKRGTAYHAQGSSGSGVQRVLDGSKRLSEHPGVCVVQAAVWIAESEITRSEFESLVGVDCAEVIPAAVTALCTQAGVAPHSSWFSNRGSRAPHTVSGEANTGSQSSVLVSLGGSPAEQVLVWILVGFAVILLGILREI